jgi:outer membrane protein assembly factor BamD
MIQLESVVHSAIWGGRLNLMRLRSASTGRANWLLVCVLGVVFLSSCGLRHRSPDVARSVNPGDQPDKVLYEKATSEINKGRFDVGRLTLQTLINTYPDSEYLSKAKLTIADSYYKEGGVSGLTQAEAEYKDFITFFPTAPEAPEAQYRAGMAHYRLMAKADRDREEAKLAEGEFKEFLLKYPDSALVPRVKRRLREVQEVLAQGDYKIATTYYLRNSLPAARSRFQEIVDSYPSFSQSDQALWYLAQTLVRMKKPQEAVPYYDRILTHFPLSPRVPATKQKLAAMHQPIPKPTKATLARAQADAARHTHMDPIGKLTGGMSSSPDTSATRRGPVDLGPPKPATVQAAAPQPGATGGGNVITVQPVGEEALKGGQPADAKPAGTAAGSTSTTKPADTPNTQDPAKPKPDGQPPNQ